MFQASSEMDSCVTISSAYECQAATSTFMWLECASRSSLLPCSLLCVTFILSFFPLLSGSFGSYHRSAQYLNKLSILHIHFPIATYTFIFFLTHTKAVFILFMYYFFSTL